MTSIILHFSNFISILNKVQDSSLMLFMATVSCTMFPFISKTIPVLSCCACVTHLLHPFVRLIHIYKIVSYFVVFSCAGRICEEAEIPLLQ
jgi:hypothetical protein